MSPMHPKANFFLVGAPKAGTTSLDRLLRSHPEVFLSPIKEPCHFCSDVNEQMAVNVPRSNGIDLKSYLASSDRRPVHLLRVSSFEDYARLFEGANGHKVVGECSSFYLSSKVAARGIHAYNSDAKIVVLLRNPLDRIRSHYAMDRSLGLASRPLLSLVEEELALGEEANWGNCSYYVGASRYARQLQEFYRYFPADQVCLLSFERLVAAPELELCRLFEFLGISVPPGPLSLPFENKSRAARFPRLHSGLRQSGIKPFVARVLENSVSARLERVARYFYYRDKVMVVSDGELHQLGALLQGEELDFDIAGCDRSGIAVSLS